MSDIETLIGIWSMRPQPGTPSGEAWEDGARIGYEWGVKESTHQLAAAQVRIDAIGEASLNAQAKFQQREKELIAHIERAVKDLISEVQAADDALSRGNRDKALLGVRLAATAASLLENTLATIPTYDENDELRNSIERLEAKCNELQKQNAKNEDNAVRLTYLYSGIKTKSNALIEMNKNKKQRSYRN